MKLNKMLALALSGVMAVSMLAGCSGAPSNGEEGQEQPPVSTNAVAVMNKAQDKVEFEADSTLETVLEAAVKKAKTDDIKSATLDNPTLLNVNNSVFDYVSAKLPKEYSVASNAITFNNGDGAGKDYTKTVVYMLKAGAYDEDTALAIVANAMDTDAYLDTYKQGDTYQADYTGSVAIKTATATNEDGDTYNAYIVAVSVTQSATKISAQQ